MNARIASVIDHACVVWLNWRHSERARVWLAMAKVALAIVLPLQVVAYLFLLQATMPLGRDAWAYIGAARAIAAGGDPYTLDIGRYVPEATVPAPPYIYPPLLAILLIPLIQLPFPIAMSVWQVIIALATLALIVLLRHLVGWKVALIAVLAFTPTWRSWWDGQVNAILAALMTLALLALRRDAATRAGIWLALGGAIKIMPGVAFVSLLARRVWRSVVAGGALMLGVVVITLPLASWETWGNGMIAALTTPRPNSWVSSWGALASLLPGDIGILAPIALGTTMLAITFVRAPKTTLPLALAAAYILPLLVARTVWEHHAVTVLPALAVLWNWNARGRGLAFVAWLLMALFSGFAMTLALTICWLACCWPRVMIGMMDTVSSVSS